MLESEILIHRKAVAERLKKCRKAYGIKILDLSIYSGLSTCTIFALEHATKDWKIDSQISYLKAIQELAASNQKYRNKVKHWPGSEVTDIHAFILKSTL